MSDALTGVRVSVAGSSIVLSPIGFDEQKVVQFTIYTEMPAATYRKPRRRWEASLTAGSRTQLANLVAELHTRGRVVEMSDETAVAVMPPSPMPPPTDDEPPVALATRAWGHQRRAFWHLAHAREQLGGALLDCGMRTGKTRMVLEHLAALPPVQRRALVVTPAAVVEVWPEQCARHVGDGDLLEVVGLYRKSVRARITNAISLLGAGKPIVVVIGWSVLERIPFDSKKLLREALDGATVVADEVHYAKAPNSSRSRNLAFISERATFKIGASGTPLAHSPLDAYGVFRFVDSGLFGSNFARFRERYAVMGGYQGHQVVAMRNLEELGAKIAPYTFRVTRDVLDLPDAQHIDVPVRLPATAMRIYRDVRDEMVADLESGVLTVTNALARLMRLAQVASGYLPRADDSTRTEQIHSEKTSALADLLDSCDLAEPWVVFCRFHHDLDEVRCAVERANRGIGTWSRHRQVFEFSGRTKQLDEWRAACRIGNGAVLAAQIQSGGIGISLVEAAFCAYYSIGYSLAEYQQSLARIHGPEQTRPVAYYHLIARDTVDIDVRRALDRRSDVIAYVVAEMMKTKQEERRHGQ